MFDRVAHVSAGWLMAIAVVATVVLPRLVVFPLSVIDWDESSYALVAQQMLLGHVPYEAVFDHKPIGLYLTFAGFFALLGDSVAAIRSVPIVFVGATAMLLAWLGRRQFGLDGIHAAVIAALYGLLTLINGGLATNTEILMNLFLTASIALLVKGGLDRRVSAPYAIAVGAALGAVLEINYLGGILVAGVAAFYLALIAGSARPVAVLRLYLANGAFIFLGFLFANFALLLPVLIAGDPAEYFRLQLAYLSGYDAGIGWRKQIDRIYEGAMPLLPFLALGAVFSLEALHRLLVREDREPRSEQGRCLRAWTVLWVFGLCAASASGRYYGHFFLLLLPASVMLAAGVLWVCRAQPAFRRASIAWMLAIAAFAPAQSAGLFVDGLLGYRNLLRDEPPDAIARVSDLMSAQLTAGETIYVYDAQPIHYFQTRTSPPTRFAFSGAHLREDEAARLGIDRGPHMRQILASEPEFIVVAGNPSELTYGDASAVLAEALRNRYTRLGVQFKSGDRDASLFRRKAVAEDVARDAVATSGT